MDILIKVAIGAAVSIGSAILAFIKGRGKSKATKSLTRVEQENDLYDYMVEECIEQEKFSKHLSNSMSKDELSTYKHSQVLKNCTMYAKGNNYSWYDKSVWSDEITNYITKANLSTKTNLGTSNQVGNMKINK